MYKKLSQATSRPLVWSQYTAEVLWADAHIAKQMLSYHLNPDIDAASRSFAFIDASVNWLVTEFNLDHTSSSIDFGCGPGLYTQRLKQLGVGTVVGLDFSVNSLNYAKQQAQETKLEVEYHYGNYLDYQDTRQFNLITLVMCDLCALNPDQRATLLSKFKTMLKPNGVIALDVYTATRFKQQPESITLAQNSMNGFWSAEDYWCIQSSFVYPNEMVTLDKYVISQTDREWCVYNWLQHFTPEMLARELEPHGLTIQAIYRDLCGQTWQEGDEMALIITHASSGPAS